MLALCGIVIIVIGIILAIIQKQWLFLIMIAAGLTVFLIGSSMSFVPSGYVGVRTAYGQISDTPTKSGFNWHAPFVEEIHNINCKQQEKDCGDLRVWSETSERTEVYCENVVVNYQINPEYAAWIWTNIEEWDTNLVKNTSIESGIKSATKKFNDTDVTDRSKIEGAAKECLQASLNSKYNNQVVDVISVTIGNINFSDAYNQAIEQKAQAKLAAEATEYTNKEAKMKVEAEAEQKRIVAEGEAEAKKIAAQGEADAIKIKADAEAEANKKIASSLTDEILELRKIEKWSGNLPKVSGSDGMIVDIKSLK